jgi:hypothetical protein
LVLSHVQRDARLSTSTKLAQLEHLEIAYQNIISEAI